MMFGSSSPFKGNFLSRCIAIASVGVVAPSAYWGTRVFPSKNDNNRRKPRHPGPPRGDCFF